MIKFLVLRYHTIFSCSAIIDFKNDFPSQITRYNLYLLGHILRKETSPLELSPRAFRALMGLKLVSDYFAQLF